MEPLPGVADAPAVSAFLDAVDAQLNSNTFLLAHRVPADVAEPGVAHALATLLHHGAFAEAMFEADRRRQWDNYRRMGQRQSGRFVRDGVALDLHRLSAAQVRSRLFWMAAVGGNWYGTAPRRDPEEAEALVEGFLGALTEAAGPLTWTQARPDFLHTTGYFDYHDDGPEDGHLAYFDGGGCDAALAGLGGDVLVLLLANGSP